MLRLALALRKGRFDVDLACPEPPDAARRSLAGEAEAAGLVPCLHLARGRGLRPMRDREDVRRLGSLLRSRDIEIVHTWHTRDHLLALRAGGLRGRRRRVRIVRSYRRAEAIAAHPWNRWLFGPGTDGLVCVSPESASRNEGLRRGRPILGAFGAVDRERFHPAAPDPRIRAALGLAPQHRVVGIVARVQRRRRFELLLEAARYLFQADPSARLLLVGRGTHRRELAEEPARRLGIADRVVFAGYRTADYADVLRSIDLFTFLVPGSDGTCRALLEAASCGIPAVVTRRGALPEIVVDGVSGLVVDEEPEALAAGWRRLLQEPELRHALGEGARRRAELEFDPRRLADQVGSFYARVAS
jgi:glycosyltransferase involved in cell wall biosynthesis